MSCISYTTKKYNCIGKISNETKYEGVGGEDEVEIRCTGECRMQNCIILINSKYSNDREKEALWKKEKLIAYIQCLRLY